MVIIKLSTNFSIPVENSQRLIINQRAIIIINLDSEKY